ncbi:unnamed protein product [Sphagnum jensenii]|uniref:Uncharacterized protein n=1 Tax=Sphagnum jensenii TaxID=128206 RepID=A0ABP0WTX0_9BRYO
MEAAGKHRALLRHLKQDHKEQAQPQAERIIYLDQTIPAELRSPEAFDHSFKTVQFGQQEYIEVHWHGHLGTHLYGWHATELIALDEHLCSNFSNLVYLFSISMSASFSSFIHMAWE